MTFGTAVRTHWQIENSVHWVLAIAFREDASCARTRHEAINLAIMRSFALTLLQHNTTVKVRIKAKRIVAAWNTDFLLALSMRLPWPLDAYGCLLFWRVLCYP